MPLTLQKPIVCIDIETTGLDIVNDRIIEIALIKLNPSGERKSKVLRINPNKAIPKEVSAVHGITNEMLKDCPVFADVANEIKQFIGDADLCGYNCLKFDVPLLVEEFLRVGINFDFDKCKIIDAQRIFHKYEPRDLSAAYKFYCQKTLDNQHNAEADAEATLEVLIAQVDKYKEVGTNVEQIEKNIGGQPAGLDLMNRIIEKNGVPIFNFGKHKGKTLAQVLKEEPQYYDWMMKSDFSLHTKQVLSSLYTKMSFSK